jgi:hypothetical protein
MGSPQTIPDDFLISACGPVEREKALPFLLQLPPAPRRLAMQLSRKFASIRDRALLRSD